jgi:hypothetical protein
MAMPLVDARGGVEQLARLMTFGLEEKGEGA